MSISVIDKCMYIYYLTARFCRIFHCSSLFHYVSDFDIVFFGFYWLNKSPYPSSASLALGMVVLGFL
jgi:hypothetical protein